MHYGLDRRELLRRTGGVLVGGVLLRHARGDDKRLPGCVVGQSEAAQAGADVLAAGGNAVDAVVAAALVAGVVAVQQCGIGGYGGHMTIGLADGTVRSIDFNSAAPRAASETMFAPDDQGRVPGNIQRYGWLASGVPGTLAGLQRAIDAYGSRGFDELVRPAIRYARDGFPVSAALAASIRGAVPQLARDPGSAALLLRDGRPLAAGERYHNPDLATLLETLAERGSVQSFYRGDIARRIAAAFAAHGGIVSEQDLAAYEACEVEPLAMAWRGYSVHTAPLTAGGVTALEALGILRALGWDNRPLDEPRTAHAMVEALRVAWHDRLALLGDPEKADVPFDRLLSASYAEEQAARVDEAVRQEQPLPGGAAGDTAGGTVHLSAGDAQGNLVALTLTHGEHFGARVAVDGLGLILGHGMSRFDARPDGPNSPGPAKRPLHNMCPTIVLRDGRPVLACGGAGGRRIPNAVFRVLAQYVGRDATADAAVAAGRIHTEGTTELTLDEHCRAGDAEYLRRIGYTVTNGSVAAVHAVSFDPASRTCRPSSRSAG